MASKVIVTIVSEQTVPNVLFIKELGPADKYIFVSTKKMEFKNTTSNIVKAAGIENNQCKIIEVIEDSLLDIDSKFSKELDLQDDDEVFVNITGGTKIMSLGVYNYFSRKGASDIFYIPLGKNQIIKVFPLRNNRLNLLNFRINLLDYLKAYGVKVQVNSFSSKNTLLKFEEQTQQLFQSFISTNKTLLTSAAEDIRANGFRGKNIHQNQEKESALFEDALVFGHSGVKFEQSNLVSRKETKYITGEWFEEFIYSIIKKTLNKSDEEIGMGVQLVKGDTPNEYDIIFTHNNSLNVIECKTDITDTEKGSINRLFTTTLYKAATLKKEFGLWVNYYIFALNDFSILTDEQKNRAKLFDIKLVGSEILSNEDALTEFIQKM